MASGIRVVNLRFGVVLSPEGGALRQMLLPFRLGLGGVLGSGNQYMSWIGLDDVVSIVDFAIQTDDLAGPVNAVAPEPVTNREFTKTLGDVLGRPTLTRVPGFALKALLGDRGALLLGSVRAFPRKLESAGYHYRHRELRSALESMLGS